MGTRDTGNDRFGFNERHNDYVDYQRGGAVATNKDLGDEVTRLLDLIAELSDSLNSLKA